VIVSDISHYAGDKIVSCQTRKRYEITDLGIMYPEEVPTVRLQPGQVGYIACNMKNSSEGEVGTVHIYKHSLLWLHNSPHR